jgi:hypothetical protein
VAWVLTDPIAGHMLISKNLLHVSCLFNYNVDDTAFLPCYSWPSGQNRAISRYKRRSSFDVED